MKLNIVLHEPEIPQNTGNIARTCAITGADLHLIKPLGFTINDKTLRRAGLDYWDKLNVYYYDNLQDFIEKHPAAELYCFTTKGKLNYTDVKYGDDVYLMFGKETKGLPEDFLLEHFDKCLRIPMRDTLRSLNLSNSVAIAAYEVERQHGFKDLVSVSEYF